MKTRTVNSLSYWVSTLLRDWQPLIIEILDCVASKLNCRSLLQYRVQSRSPVVVSSPYTATFLMSLMRPVWVDVAFFLNIQYWCGGRDYNYNRMKSKLQPEGQSNEVRESNKPKPLQVTPAMTQVDDRWMEFKIIGKNIQPRSYHVSVVYGSYLYIQGGYDVDKGFLSDFYRLQLQNEFDGFKWQQLPETHPNYPGKLKGHSAVLYKTTMLLFGGQVHDGEGSNNTYIYDFIKSTWDKIKASPQIPRLDSHSAFVVGDTMYIYGGFRDKQASYSSNIYALDLITKTWSTFYTASKTAPAPEARGNVGLALYKDCVWVFGGTNGTKTLNDLWKFNLATKTWTEIQTENAPQPRRSHTFVAHQQSMYLFGGIQDVTKQKNDIYLFIPDESKWIRIHNSSNLIYECSPTIKRNRSGQRKKANSPTRKVQHRISLLNINHQKTKEQGATDKNQVMKRIIQQNKYKKFLERKQQLLKQFSEAPPPEQQKRKLSPTSQNMLKTLQLIGDQEHSKKIMHQEVVYDATRKYIMGKKPCARDAHSAVVYNERMLIFGGDRHLMSFSDIYYFDLKKGFDSKKLYEH